MRKEWLMGGLVLGLAAVAVAGNRDGFTDLFNGKDLSGWVQRGGKAKFEVRDGMIVGRSVPNTPNSFLCTKKTYANFILEFDFKGHPKLNSGVQIRSESTPDFKHGRVHGYQCELEDEDRGRYWSGGIYGEGDRGWLYPKKDDKALCARFSKEGRKCWKKGAWNHVKIVADGDSIKTWINGVPRADLKDSKVARGFIGLQVHNVGRNTTPMEVMWKNLRIKELP